MTSQNKAFLSQIRTMFKKVLGENDYRGFSQSRKGGCTMCHGSGVVPKGVIPTNGYRDSGAGKTGGRRRKRGGQITVPVGVVPKRVTRASGKPKRGGKATNPWLTHVMQVRKANPGMAFKAILQKAKSSY